MQRIVGKVRRSSSSLLEGAQRTLFGSTLDEGPSSFRHLVTWESTVVVLCALVLSIVFGFFIHQSFHSRTSNGLMAAYDTHDSHDNVDASNWPHRDAEAVSMKGSVDIRRLEGPTFRTRKSKTRKHISSKRHTTKSTMKDTKTHGPRAQQRVPEKQKSLNEKLKKTKKKKKNNSAKALKPKTIPSTTEESNEPVKGLKPSGISNHLLCFMSDNATDKMQMPAEYCTHLVYKDMTLSKQSHTFVPAKNGTGFDEFMSLRERFVTTKFVVSLSTAMVRELLDYADRDDHNLAAICTQLAKWISENELNGVAFTGQLITSTRHKSMLAVLKSVQDALKQLGEPKPALIYSGYASHDQYTQKSIMDRIKDYLRAADIFVIETHYHEEEQFCRLVYPSIFVRVDDTPSSIPVKSALLWMEMVKEDGGLNGTHNLCFSLDMSTMSFDVAANSRPTVGGWCTGRKWINYGQMCGTNVWVTPDEDRVALSTSRRKPQTWLAYDSEDAIKKKVGRAMDVFHGVCVAVFHVDHDDSAAICDGINRFPRLQAIREVQKHHVEKEFYGVEKKPPPRSQDRERSKSLPSEPAVLCVAGDLLSDMDHYPTEHCTHLIYRDMVFFSEHKWFMPREDEQSFKQFKELRAKTSLPLLVGVSAEQLSDFYARLWRNPPKMGHFARSAIEWLNLQGFDGIALLDQEVKAADVGRRYFHIVKRLHDEFSRVKRKLLIVVGLSITDHEKTAEDVAEHLEDIARYSDYLILETHRIKRQGQCKLSLPSSFLEDGTLTSSVPIRTALAWMRILHVENETSAHLCISFNMAALNFKTRKGDKNLTCKNERWSNYRDVCSSKDGYQIPVHVDGALGMYRTNQNAWQTFDEETTLREKVERAVTLYPRLCVAAFYLEYEDSMGLCRPKFSRLSEIAQTLNKGPVENLVELKPPINDGAHNLICVMSEKTSVQQQFPNEACDFVVFMDLTYNGQEDKLVPKTNGSGFELFSAMAANGSGNHLVAVSHEDIRECVDKWKDPLALSHFVITTSSWITKNKFDGLAFLGVHVPNDRLPTLHKMLQKFHEAFKENRPRSLLLMFAIQVTNYKAASVELLQNLQKIVKVVDYTILETHHSRPLTTCNALLPTSFREYSDLADSVPVVTALEWTKQLQNGVEPLPNLCFSLSLASLHYTLKTTTNNVGAPCDDEKLIPYNQTCSRDDWVGPIQDERAIAAYHYRNNQWQSFLTPDSITKMMRLALKVNPSVCVAAYYVDYEDYMGMCKHNQTFPRLTAVRHVLDQVRTR
ncbi:uncharacterized protein LOC119460932 isoform X3 [Dermacentor silvarum]|uniref:uncharacterized protein LOC119460932 isoform X3 n=1 Tax=Dermacentor silvarum TaxID=543639 RepID=UPI002100D46F|nr:uncharacterized protein LOC119460932 isoform X3 [Dermacentor silvarum]